MADPGDDETTPAPAPSANGSKTNNDKPTARDAMPPPPLPPRRAGTPPDSAAAPAEAGPRQAKATTAVSSVDIQTLTFPDGSRGTFSTPGVQDIATSNSPTRSVHSAHQRIASTSSGHVSPNVGAGGLYGPATTNEVPVDAMSIMSFAPTMRPQGDLASLVAGDFHKKSRAWSLLKTQAANVQPFESTRTARVPYDLADFEKEFEDIKDGNDEDVADGSEEVRLAHWKAKLKHYMILSSAGKPIWSRHGDLSLINSYMGVMQTIISFYEGEKNPLQGFTAGNARFVIATEGPLYLVAISRLGESDTQLRDQLRALYMQILSTLTLPTLTNIFANRPSTDLRKPLQGTEGLLATLADTFTKGSPSSLLGALECLRLRKSQRYAITNAFLKQRTDKLLYGLIVADGKLVSVIRPRKHSLHPSDLQLIFNMLFESGGVKAGGGENWIPLCLPAFNNRGYLYMYVSFFDSEEASQKPSSSRSSPSPAASAPTSAAASLRSAKASLSASSQQQKDESIAIILISTDKESFFDLKEMREKVALSLTKNGGLAIIRAAAAAGRPQVADIIRRPGTAVQISHFLFKSRANVQFVMSSLAPEFFGGSRRSTITSGSSDTEDEKQQLEAQRRLMTLYHQLHAAVHARHSHLKVLHCVGEDATSLAWITPVFEFYCVAGPNSSRSVVTQDANRIIQWAKREEERLFIIGGGVF